MSEQQWPKWVNGRIAKSPDEAVVLLSHTQACAIHADEIIADWRGKEGAQRLRPRHPDHEFKCDCGGVTPSAEDLAEAGVAPAKKPLTAAQVAALDRIPGDGVIKAGGAPKGGNRKTKKTAR